MKVLFYTTAGPLRPINQDGLYINGKEFTKMDEPESAAIPEQDTMLAVIDGMGGMGGGEEATAIILSELAAFFSAGSVECHNLKSGLLEIQKRLHVRASQYSSMGATIAGIWIDANQGLVYNCGDCRVYKSRSGFLEKLSHDHSIVQELADNDMISEDEMRTHPRKNVVTSSLSADDPDPRIFCREIAIRPGDRFLLCSDGLWECLSLEELERCMSHEPEQAALMLRKEIWAKGARDNASFIIASQE